MKNRKIYDPIRKKMVVKTPEEEVRQFVIRFLQENCRIPAGYISVESPLEIFQVSFRSDIQVRNRNGKTVLLIECKRPSVVLNGKVLEQAMRYSLVGHERFIVITNGIDFRCFERRYGMQEEQWSERDCYPDWNELNEDDVR